MPALDMLIRHTLSLAGAASRKGNHPFGALLAIDGEIVLEAENTVGVDGDCTRHAELNLVSLAARQLAPDRLATCTLVSSTEPCPMCSGALYWAGIRRVVYGCPAEVLGEIAGGGLVVPCREIFIRAKDEVEVIGPVLREEAAQVHRDFWPRAR